MNDIEFSDIGDTEAMDSFGEQPDSAIDAGDSTMEGADTSHSVSFGARLDRERYRQLQQEYREADAIVKSTGDEIERIDAYNRRCEISKEMNDLYFSSDEVKQANANWENNLLDSVEGVLSPSSFATLREKFKRISFRGNLAGSDSDGGVSGLEAHDESFGVEAANETQDALLATGMNESEVDPSSGTAIGEVSEQSDAEVESAAAEDEARLEDGSSTGGGGNVSFRGSTSQYYCPVCGHTWWSPSWPTYCPKSGCLGSPKKM